MYNLKISIKILKYIKINFKSHAFFFKSLNKQTANNFQNCSNNTKNSHNNFRLTFSLKIPSLNRQS